MTLCKAGFGNEVFCTQWCHWIDTIIQGDHVGIKINDQIGLNIQTKKGLRQGDPLSPLLFNIMVYMMDILIKRAKMEGTTRWPG
jgi:hypothetical protein